MSKSIAATIPVPRDGEAFGGAGRGRIEGYELAGKKKSAKKTPAPAKGKQPPAPAKKPGKGKK